MNLDELQQRALETKKPEDIRDFVTELQRVGVKPTSSKVIMLELQDSINQIEAARKRQRAEGKQLFERYVGALFEENPQLKSIVLLGSTPSFNDGEPCTHSMDIVLTKEDANDYGVDEDLEDENVELTPELSKAQAKAIRDALFKFEEVLEEIYDTNWRLTILRKNGKVKIEQDDYDCGH